MLIDWLTFGGGIRLKLNVQGQGWKNFGRRWSRGIGSS